MSSRSLDDLKPAAHAKLADFLDDVKLANIDYLITCTTRSISEQDALYAQGRTAPGKIVTNAKGGDSFHNWACAIDLVPLRCGKPLWSVFAMNGTMEPEWQKLGELAALHGITWAGTWKTFKEYAHFQYTGGLTLADFKAGKELK